MVTSFKVVLFTFVFTIVMTYEPPIRSYAKEITQIKQLPRDSTSTIQLPIKLIDSLSVITKKLEPISERKFKLSTIKYQQEQIKYQMALIDKLSKE